MANTGISDGAGPVIEANTAAAGWLLELTPEDAEEYAERAQLLERILEAQPSGE